MSIVRLTEYTKTTDRMVVNREAGTFGPAKLLGWKSANGYDYLPEGVAPSLYEGRPINLNHQREASGSRDVRDVFGWPEGVERRADGIWAKTIHVLNPKSEAAESVFRAAEHKPDLFGFSHVADGRKKTMPSGVVIEAVERVESVDLVVGPATTKGLNESRNTVAKITVREALTHVWKDQPAKLALLKEMDGDPMLGAEMDAPAAPGGDPDAALKAGFKAAIHAVVDDDSLDMAAKLAKIKEILKAQEKLMGGGETPAEEPAEEPSEDEPAEESAKRLAATDAALKRVQEDLRQERELRVVSELVHESGLAFTKPEARKAFVKSLVPLTEAERKALVDERKTQAAERSPRSVAPVYPVQETVGGAPTRTWFSN